MSTQHTAELVIAISSRALFDLNESHRIYQNEGLTAYQKYQIAHENDPLSPGEAFALVKKLLRINQLMQSKDCLGVSPQAARSVEVLLLSRNSADTGLRIFNSIQHYGLSITRAAFCCGESPYRYAADFGCHLFLSAHAEDVAAALASGVAAATLLPSGQASTQHDADRLKFAFDGDAVLFSNEAEMIYQVHGLDAFVKNEVQAAGTPLESGPFKPFLLALHRLQSRFSPSASPIRTALVTARSAPAHERVIRTLRAWNIRIDETLFLGGLPKSDFLKSYGADVFFDDQLLHCEAAKQYVATGHVPYGTTNP